MSSNKGSYRKCGRSKCRNPIKTMESASGRKVVSEWCKNHTCKVGWGCTHRRSSKSGKYCSSHMTCNKEGCSVPGHQLHKRTSKWFCPEHECENASCAKARRSNSSYCTDHHRSEELPIGECMVMNCKDPRYPNYHFCLGHKCPAPDCLNFQSYCNDHLKCHARDCSHLVQWNTHKGQAEPFCFRHANCRMDSCEVIIDGALKFCDRHVCGVDGCHEGKYLWDTKSNFCRAHTCDSKGCKTAIEASAHPGPNDSGVVFRHCRDHTCSRSSCSNPARFKYAQCEQHACKVKACDSNISDGHAYCRNHECADPACRDAADHGRGVRFCTARHACKWESEPHEAPCREHRLGQDRYPELCISHAIQQDRADQAAEQSREQEEKAQKVAAAQEAQSERKRQYEAGFAEAEKKRQREREEMEQRYWEQEYARRREEQRKQDEKFWAFLSRSRRFHRREYG